MKKTICAFLFTGIVLFDREAFGEMSGNQPLHHAIYAEHDPKLIVAGTIVGKDVKPRASGGLYYPADINFHFAITSVLLGPQTYNGQTLVIPATTFEWPTELLPFQKNVKCALVLQTDWGDKRDGYYLYSVVPVSSLTLPQAKDGEEAKRILEKEILTELAGEKRPERQEALLLQIAPILRPEGVPAIVPFLTSKDIWVVRSALAAAIYATEDKAYIRKAAEDVQSFATNTKSSDLVKNTYDPYSYFFQHYFFLEKRTWTWGSSWTVEEANKHLRILKALFDTGILSDGVKKKMKFEPLGGDKKPALQS